MVDLFFLGQYVIASLMAPSFAAGAITGEKERKTYEMLLASPLRPGAIVLGKLLASLAHLAILIFSSLPIVMLCLPLGGVSIYEVLAAYLALVLSIVTFGMISVACSSYFQRTASSLLVSYLLILPLALIGVLTWRGFAAHGELASVRGRHGAARNLPRRFAFRCFRRPFAGYCIRPTWAAKETKWSIWNRKRKQAVGLVIQRDQFPDRLFAPARTQFAAAGSRQSGLRQGNAERDFRAGHVDAAAGDPSQHVSGDSADGDLPVRPASLVPWYISYVMLFNMLVGPVFSAGSVTSERERQTLDLLLTTILSPGQILRGKLISGLAGFQRADVVFAVAALVGVHHGADLWRFGRRTIASICFR